jgi:hypothetical protein
LEPLGTVARRGFLSRAGYEPLRAWSVTRASFMHGGGCVRGVVYAAPRPVRGDATGGA